MRAYTSGDTGLQFQARVAHTGGGFPGDIRVQFARAHDVPAFRGAAGPASISIEFLPRRT